MPISEHDDDAFGGTVVTLTPPDGLDALPGDLRDALPDALVAAFEEPAARLADAAQKVPLPGFRAFCERLAALPASVEVAYDSFAHDDDARLVFGTYPDAGSTPTMDDDTGADDLPAPPPLPGALPGLDLAELEQAMPEGTLTPELKAHVEAFGAKMQRALTPPKAGAVATAAAAALSFAPPDVLDAPPLLEQVYAAVGTVRLGPPGAGAGLVAAQPVDYRLEMADPDYLAVFETDTGDVLATTEDGSAAAWFMAADDGETMHPAGTLADALDAVFAALARGEMPRPLVV